MKRVSPSLCFSAKIRAGITDTTAVEGMDKIESLYARGSRLTVARISVAEVSPVAKLPVKIAVLSHVALRRTLELAASFVREVNAVALLAPFLLSRAALETACLAFHIWKEAEECTKADDTSALSLLHEQADKALLGAKSTKYRFELLPQSINVLTIVQHIEKRNIPGITELYEGLAEFCHPNFAGTAGAFQEIHEDRYETTFGKLAEQEIIDRLRIALGPMALALMMVVEVIKALHVSLPALVRLCEREIFEGGTWPKGLPYPRREIDQ